MSVIEYEHYRDVFINSINEYQYIFELRKCCGYKEWIMIYKSKTVKDLYDNVYCQFKIPTNRNPPIKLFMIQNEEKIEVINDDTLLYDYICTNQEYLRAIYPLPCKVVYSLYVDDGTCHEDHTTTPCYLHSSNIELK